MIDPITQNEAITDKGSETDGPMPWPTDDQEIVRRVRNRKKLAEEGLSKWYEEAGIDFQFAEGKQYTDEDAEKLDSEGRVAAVFNRCAPVINAILGQEVTNRQEVRFLPRKIGEVSTADPMNDAVRWVREQCNAEDEDSDAFSDMVTCGMGWTVTRMDYEENPEGMPDVQRRDPLLMRWDPAARRKNLADKKWVQADYWMPVEQIEDRWPDADVSSVVNLNLPNERQEPHDSTEAWKYKNDAAGMDRYQDQLRVIHHVEHFGVKRYKMVDPASGQEREYSEQEYKQMQATAAAAGIQLPQSLPIKRRMYWQAWTCGEVVLEAGLQAAQKAFCYEAMTCYRERETGFWYGVIRMMRDPQRYANRLMSLMMSILAMGPKAGVLYETGSFVNPKKAKEDWARFDSVIEVKPGSLGAGAIQPKPPQAMPQGAAELMQFAVASIRDVTGVNIDMLGGADRDQPGVVEDMRTKSGLTILAKVFDALRLYRKRQGVLLAEFVERFISDGRLIRIIGKTGQQFVPLLRQGDSLEYDMVVDESPAARDVKERTWMALQVLTPMALQAGLPIPPSALDYAPIPQSLAMEWKQMIAEKMQQGPQPAPIVEAEKIKAQAKMQSDQATLQAKMQSDQAKTQADQQVQQMKLMHQRELEQMKMQREQAIEQAQMQADMQVQQHKAAMDYQFKLMESEQKMRLDAMQAQVDQQTQMRIEEMRSATQLRIAEMNAGQQQQQADQQRQSADSGHQATQGLTKIIAELHRAMMSPRERVIVRGPDGRAVKAVDSPTMQ